MRYSTAMRILLCTPARVVKSCADSSAVYSNTPGVTLPQLAACVPDHHVEIFDGIGFNAPLKDLTERSASFDIIAFTISSSFVSLDLEINIQTLKDLHPSKMIILGGHHATLFSQEWLNKGADFIVRGEGELTFPSLVTAINNNGSYATVLGISYKDEDGTCIENIDRPLIENLDDIPIPRFDLLDLDKYQFFTNPDAQCGTIETSRGCWHKCNYCFVPPYWKNTHRYKSAKRVLEEISILKKMGVITVFFVDDDFGSNAKREKEIFQGIIDADYDIKWVSFMRADYIYNQPDLVDLAARSGCIIFMTGYESIKNDALQAYDKGLSLTAEKFSSIYKTLKRSNIFLLSFFISVYPDGRCMSAKDLFDLLFRASGNICDFLILGSVKPFAGTSFHKQLKEKDLLARDMFYHAPFIPPIKETKKLIFHLAALYFLYLFCFGRLKMLFGKNSFKRRFILHVYRSVFDMLTNFKNKSFFLFFTLRGKKTAQEKINAYVDFYKNKFLH
jgi:radical SAM superfamily enzyme YgiQ (UPF0313 family)